MPESKEVKEKIDKLVELTGEDFEALLDNPHINTPGMSKGICINEGCDFFTDIEAEKDGGLCTVCNTNTVASIEVLADKL